MESYRRPRLRVTTPKGVTKTIRLGDDPVSLGRADSNRLAFPEDNGLSREHLFIERRREGWEVRDLGSKNGTFVNGRRLTSSRTLESGDTISASCVTLTYLGSEPESGVCVEPPEDRREPVFTECIRLRDLRLAAPAVESQPVAERVNALWAFSRAGRELTASRPLPELFEMVLELSLEAVGASRGVLLTLDERDRLVSRASSGGDFHISTTVCDRVLKEASSVLIEDVPGDEELRSKSSFLGERPRSLMAVPLQTVERVIGLVYVESLRKAFASEDLHLLTVMASVAGARIEREYWEQQRRFLISENLASLTRLAAVLSHELNTPLGALKSTVESLMLAAERREAAPPEERRRLEEVQADLRRALDASLERMQQVVGRMQRFTNLDRADVQAIDLRELLEDVIALGHDGNGGAHVAVELREESAPLVMARPQHLSAAFSSLLSFVKNASSGPLVRVLIGESDGSAMLRVVAEPETLPEERLGSIFEPQFEVAEGHVAMGNWTLFSARQLVRAEGGEMRVNKDCHAVTFAVTLPTGS